jgi:OmpA-OmpF porin, OOP family
LTTVNRADGGDERGVVRGRKMDSPRARSGVMLKLVLCRRRAHRTPAAIVLALTALLACSLGVAAPGDKPVPPLPAGSVQPSSALTIRTASLPAKGLFVGDQLSASARDRLAELIVDSAGTQIEIALVVPTGPWQLEGSGRDERDLTPARLQSLKRYLGERGVDPKRILVESRIDEKVKDPRLDLQMVTRPSND